jgi:hypothetical protein
VPIRAEGRQTLLGTIMKIALDPASGVIRGRDDPDYRPA